jgi:N6-L-threonylcarbamoyladenine synthase
MIVLGIETSCDDTSAAVVVDGRQVLDCTVSSQDRFHQRFGGVVPEIASRAHMEVIDAVCADTLERSGLAPSQVDAVAVTNGPGLVGSILVGLGFAKGFAYARGLPFLGVNHLEGRRLSRPAAAGFSVRGVGGVRRAHAFVRGGRLFHDARPRPDDG